MILLNRKEFDAAEKRAAKSDILRYELCAEFGGVYIDADFEPLRPIEPLLAGVSSFQADELDDRPCNAILGSVAGDPFYRLAGAVALSCSRLSAAAISSKPPARRF